MSPARVGVDEGAEQQPSHRAIDNGNPAVFKPKWFVLDDINVDLISFLTTFATFACIFLFGLVLITGASSGIGAELSYIFADKGHDLILVGRNEDQLEAVKKKIKEKYGHKAYTISSDPSMPGSAKQFEVEILANDAALGAAGDTIEQPIELAERMTTLNCITLVQLTQLFCRDMIKRQRGWIMQVGSVGSFMASPGQNIYHASKYFVRAFSEALSVELRAYPGIVNTLLLPGPTHTQFVTHAHAEEAIMFSTTNAVEDPKVVAMSGYKGLCKGKRIAFSTWNSAFMALQMCFAPRSVQLTLAAITNAPTRGKYRMQEPQGDQNVRGKEL